jgi:hypothetical protein
MQTVQDVRVTITLLRLLLVAIGFLMPEPTVAQAHTLRVSIHDARGQGLAGITVVVRSEAGQELGRQATNAEGAASFDSLPAVVRVVVEGQARGGPRLYQLGDDTHGVRLDLSLGARAGGLDLRVERDGLVLPDPATMLTLEEGGPIVEEAVPLPTAVIATPAPLPTTSVGGMGAVTVGSAGAESRGAGWVPWVSVLIIAFAAGVMLLIQRRRDA